MLKVKVISLPYIFQVLYVLCFTRPRYQVSVYRTIGPLVSMSIFFQVHVWQLKFVYLDVTKCDLVHDERYMSCVMRKTAFCICKNKDADQLPSNCAADQRLCFHYIDSTIPLLPKSENSNL